MADEVLAGELDRAAAAVASQLLNIKLLRSQGWLPATTEDLRERLLAWRPPLDPGTIEREIASMTYDQEEGTENMVCPPPWPRTSLPSGKRADLRQPSSGKRSPTCAPASRSSSCGPLQEQGHQ